MPTLPQRERSVDDLYLQGFVGEAAARIAAEEGVSFPEAMDLLDRRLGDYVRRWHEQHPETEG